MPDRTEFGLVMGQPDVGRTTTDFIHVGLRISDPAHSYGTDDVSLTLVLHPRQARVLVEALQSELDRALWQD